MAHRGLHDAARGVIENSPSAFEAAARASYGIELDVVASADGEAIVFHDKDFDRLTGQTGLVRERSAAEITQILLDRSADTIPTLGDVFDLVASRVPLLIEIKNRSRKVGLIEARVADLIASYGGPLAVQSFNPYSLGWFATNAPNVLRGQISEGFHDTDADRLPIYQRFLLRHLLLSAISRPNFIAYDRKALPAFAPRCAKALGLPVLGWTVKSAAEADRLKPHVDNIIFEDFRPPLPEPALVGEADTVTVDG